MNIGFKPKGDWKKIHITLLRRKERIEAMRKRMMRDIVERVKEEVEHPLPKTEEMKAYKDSLELRKVEGSFKEGELAYALISNPEPLEISKLSEETNVIYVLPKGDPTNALGELLITYSPWVKSRLPEKYDLVRGISFVHRRVSKEETDKVRKRNTKTLKEYAEEFRRAGANVRKEEEPDAPKSIPDTMFDAIRMEFGIMTKAIPHWGRANSKRVAILKEILKDKKKYTQYVVDFDFNGWVQKLPRWRTISAQKFKTMYGEFDKKITGK